MKVLLLNGSANKNGNTFTALSEIARQLEKNLFGQKHRNACDNAFSTKRIKWLFSQVRD
jgi:multimeric flavodoxin WrbA